MTSENLARIQAPERSLSTQMRAVLLIFGADRFLLEAVKPFIDYREENIFWDHIWKIPLCRRHKAAVLFAYAVWRDETRPKSNLFDAALSMNLSLKRACLDALALRWGLN